MSSSSIFAAGKVESGPVPKIRMTKSEVRKKSEVRSSKLEAAALRGAKESPSSRPRRMEMADGHSAIELWLGRVRPELQPLVLRLDRLILETMPVVVCAIKWGVPFYGLRDHGWIAAINSFKAHVKLLFFAGSVLKPMLPAGKEHKAIDFHSDEELDQNEKQVKVWLQQAKKLPGWNLKNFPSKVS